MTNPSSPHGRARVGMIGGGQLARMTAIAAAGLDVAVGVLAESAEDPAVEVSARSFVGAPSSIDAVRRLAEWADVVTFDHEHVPPELLRTLEGEGHVFRPGSSPKLLAQDKAVQRRVLGEQLGLPVPRHALVRSAGDVERFAREAGWPVVLKDTRGGYDGRGVAVVDDMAEAEGVLERARGLGVDVLAESLVPIESELAVVLARSPSGRHAVYPVVETVQREGICREMIAPAPLGDSLQAQARELAVSIADGIDATGILAVEMFVADGGLLINELALRPHNSGHFTLGGCVTSQFENHLRAVLDWPLGDPSLVAPSVACVNVLGGSDGSDPRMRLPEALRVRGASVQLYGKQARAGRKLGHVTVGGDERSETLARARDAVSLLTGEPVS